MAVVIGGHLLLAPAPITARAVATMLSLMLMRLAHQAARARALRTLALVIGHSDKSLHKRRAHARRNGTSASSAERLARHDRAAAQARRMGQRGLPVYLAQVRITMARRLRLYRWSYR